VKDSKDGVIGWHCSPAHTSHWVEVRNSGTKADAESCI